VYSSFIVFLEILEKIEQKITTCQTITLHMQQKQHGFPALFHMIHKHKVHDEYHHQEHVKCSKKSDSIMQAHHPTG
jgi:S-adenosylmethionine:tRNA-ribosyltransferase-isomerase (queuine synthetase)